MKYIIKLIVIIFLFIEIVIIVVDFIIFVDSWGFDSLEWDDWIRRRDEI